MVAVIRSIYDIYKRLPDEDAARDFLEEMIWTEGRFCPHCGSLDSRPLRGKSTRPGLYQCAERECRRQFTITTKTPMHATKLDLRTWVLAIFLVLNSSKGMSSVVLARHLGVTQKTAWRIGHALRQMMDTEGGTGGRLTGVVEVDEAFVGGAPRYQKGVKNKRGRGCKKQLVLVAAGRGGGVRAARIASAAGATIEPVMTRWITPESTLMTDGNPTYKKIGRGFQAHHTVKHSAKQFHDPATGAHINTAEAFSGYVERARVGVYHRITGQHTQRYLDELAWRWNRRQSFQKTRKNGTTHCVWKPLPVMTLMRDLLSKAVGSQVRRSSNYGLTLVSRSASFGG